MKTDLPIVAPDEALVATLGLENVIDRTPKKIGKADMMAIATLPKRLEQSARALILGEITKPEKRPLIDYPKMMRRLLGDNFGLAENVAIVDSFPEDFHDQGVLYAGKASQIVKLLQKAYPLATQITYAGPKTLLPNDVSVWRWAGLLQVADDPLCVFSLIASAALTENQAKALRMAYPSLSEAIDAAIQNAVIDEKTKKKSYELPPRAELGIKPWQGKPMYEKALVNNLQANVAKSMQDKQAPAKPEGAANVGAKSDLTATQKAAYAATGNS